MYFGSSKSWAALGPWLIVGTLAIFAWIGFFGYLLVTWIASHIHWS